MPDFAFFLCTVGRGGFSRRFSTPAGADGLIAAARMCARAGRSPNEQRADAPFAAFSSMKASAMTLRSTVERTTISPVSLAKRLRENNMLSAPKRKVPR